LLLLVFLTGLVLLLLILAIHVRLLRLQEDNTAKGMPSIGAPSGSSGAVAPADAFIAVPYRE
jgi:hypothetical protein